MITLLELLEDKVYAKFFTSQPPPEAQRSIALRTVPNWRVFVQKQQDGGWSTANAQTYTAAFKFIRKLLKDGSLYDGAIHSQGYSFAAPVKWVRVSKGGKPVMMVGSDGVQRQQTKQVVWRPKLEGDEPEHRWCPWCRRPTVFRFFRMHRTFRNTPLAEFYDPSRRRCTICGASDEIC